MLTSTLKSCCLTIVSENNNNTLCDPQALIIPDKLRIVFAELTFIRIISSSCYQLISNSELSKYVPYPLVIKSDQSPDNRAVVLIVLSYGSCLLLALQAGFNAIIWCNMSFRPPSLL